MERVFENIPHVERHVYERTFMNEISLFFSYNSIDLGVAGEVLGRLKSMDIQIDKNSDENDLKAISIKDKDALVTFTSKAVLVSLPSRKYVDFTTTKSLWDDVESWLKKLEIKPSVWSFTKGNRWVFRKPISPEQEADVLKVVLSKELLGKSRENHIYVEESKDKSCVFTCRYSMEKVNGNDSLGLKTMITCQSYSTDKLSEQVFRVNEWMFDVWSWCVSDSIKDLMSKGLNANGK
ncbi:MAG: hypothetical protein IK017_09785 [Paludibacteraceae bacterium]|nr:hypothetical protein [Paludibacteraceae bacterium]